MNRRKAIKLVSSGITLCSVPLSGFKFKSKKIDLSRVRRTIRSHFNDLLPKNKPYGAYNTGVSEATDVYASCDIAIARHIMGEDFSKSISKNQRKQWIDYINSYQQSGDGSYTHWLNNHSKLHANGMTIGALGVLEGRQKYKVKLYDEFNTLEKVIPWLEQINWARQWGASHLFWGGIHCYSMSSCCQPDWLNTVFDWLNTNIDRETGWWRKGVPHTDRHQPLGGSVHILPIYEHHNRQFPYPEEVIDSVLGLQLPSGRWLAREKDQKHVMHYLELDALYALKYMGTLAPEYRTKDILDAVNRYGDLVYGYWNDPTNKWKGQHPHRILSMVGTFGLLQYFLPERFSDNVVWSDIFSYIKLYNTSAVEAK